jgi:AraC-like DNA-binding protein
MAILTVANISSRAIVDFCASKGVASDPLLTAAGIPQRLLAEPGSRISADRVFTLWGEAQKVTHDVWIAEHVAGLVPFGAYTIGDYLLAAGPTLRQAMDKLVRLFPLVNEAFELRLTSRGPESRLELHSPYDPESPTRLHVEFFFALIQSRLRYAAGIDWRPREVWFTHPSPPDCPNYHQTFQCRVRFAQPVNQMVLENEFLEYSLPYADPLLSEMLELHARRQLKECSEDYFLRDFRQAVYEGFGRGDLRLRTTARKLALSGRSLQRELNSRGTSYRTELDGFRRDLALDLLLHEPIQEVVTLLRFSESSAFYRAFRRWTGKTPQEYLEMLSSAPLPRR